MQAESLHRLEAPADAERARSRVEEAVLGGSKWGVPPDGSPDVQLHRSLRVFGLNDAPVRWLGFGCQVGSPWQEPELSEYTVSDGVRN